MCAEEPWHIHSLPLWGWSLPFGGALIWRPTHSILWAGNTVENIFLGSQKMQISATTSFAVLSQEEFYTVQQNQ